MTDEEIRAMGLELAQDAINFNQEFLDTSEKVSERLEGSGLGDDEIDAIAEKVHTWAVSCKAVLP